MENCSWQKVNKEYPSQEALSTKKQISIDFPKVNSKTYPPHLARKYPVSKIFHKCNCFPQLQNARIGFSFAIIKLQSINLPKTSPKRPFQPKRKSLLTVQKSSPKPIPSPFSRKVSSSKDCSKIFFFFTFAEHMYRIFFLSYKIAIRESLLLKQNFA